MEINKRRLVKYNIVNFSLIDKKIENLYIFFFDVFYINVVFILFV